MAFPLTSKYLFRFFCVLDLCVEKNGINMVLNAGFFWFQLNILIIQNGKCNITRKGKALVN